MCFLEGWADNGHAARRDKVVAFGFAVGREQERRLLLVNTGSVAARLAVANATGASHVFVDEAHGHGNELPGREAVGAGGLVTVGGYGVSVVAWPPAGGPAVAGA